MKIKVEPFMIKRGNRVANAAIEFEESDSILAGFHLVGFTICEDEEKGLFVLFPASNTDKKDKVIGAKNYPYFFLRPSNETLIEKLESAILDVYESMTANKS
jgi:hypothetical protein